MAKVINFPSKSAHGKTAQAGVCAEIIAMPKPALNLTKRIQQSAPLPKRVNRK